MTRNGELFPRPMLERLTSASGGGSWHIPTPTSADVYTGNMELSQQSDDSMHSVSLPDFVNRWPTPTSTERSGTNPNTGKGEGLSKTAKMFPTPRADESYQGDGAARGYAEAGFKQPRHRYDKDGKLVNRADYGKTGQGTFDTTLTTAVKAQQLFPTPRAGKTTDEDEESWLARHAEGKVATPPLALAARMLPTPNSRDHKDAGPNVNWEPIAKKSKLAGVVQMLPTPTTQEIEHPDIDLDDTGRRKTKDGRTGSEARSLNLADTARMLPTPTGDDANNVTRTSGAFQSLSREVDGSLSPDWVSWLMGLPVGWTSLEPLPREEYLD